MIHSSDKVDQRISLWPALTQKDKFKVIFLVYMTCPRKRYSGFYNHLEGGRTTRAGEDQRETLLLRLFQNVLQFKVVSRQKFHTLGYCLYFSEPQHYYSISL
jgi:hypothetical protein